MRRGVGALALIDDVGLTPPETCRGNTTPRRPVESTEMELATVMHIAQSQCAVELLRVSKNFVVVAPLKT